MTSLFLLNALTAIREVVKDVHGGIKMWALAKDGLIRHDFGGQNPPLAICGHIGEHPLNYNAVKTPKCQQCLSLWSTYKGNGGKKE